MTVTPLPTDPPTTAGEVETLRGFLDFYRDVLRRKAEGLAAADLDRSLPPSTMTLGGMLKHLALVEETWVSYRLAGREPSEPWASAPWDDDEDWDWHSATADDPAGLRELHDRTVLEVDAILDELCAGPEGLDRLSVREVRGGRVNVRWVLVHLLEEYARHAGHADLLREAVDGATGD